MSFPTRPDDTSEEGRRLLVAELVAESAVFQRNAAWACLAETRAALLAAHGAAVRPMALKDALPGPSLSGVGRTPLCDCGGPDESSARDSLPARRDAARTEASGSLSPSSPSLRIALVGSPRTGNTWIRTLLAESYGLAEMAVHAPTHLPWPSLPDRLIVQLHWHRLPVFRAMLRAFGFRVVTVARHPLDVLVSVLQFCQSEPATEFWLSGEGGDEARLLGASPHDDGFRTWALSNRARALLSVTPEWWDDGEAIRIRYEDVVAQPGAALAQVAKRLGAEPVRDVGEVGQRVSLEEMRRRFSANPGHFWKGRPGVGSEVLDSATAGAIAAAHAPVFRALEYPSRTVERSVEEARDAWRRHNATLRDGAA